MEFEMSCLVCIIQSHMLLFTKYASGTVAQKLKFFCFFSKKSISIKKIS